MEGHAEQMSAFSSTLTKDNPNKSQYTWSRREERELKQLLELYQNLEERENEQTQIATYWHTQTVKRLEVAQKKIAIEEALIEDQVRISDAKTVSDLLELQQTIYHIRKRMERNATKRKRAQQCEAKDRKKQFYQLLSEKKNPVLIFKTEEEMRRIQLQQNLLVEKIAKQKMQIQSILGTELDNRIQEQNLLLQEQSLLQKKEFQAAKMWNNKLKKLSGKVTQFTNRSHTTFLTKI
ncbi:erythrocyte binding protein [Reticulomyxa filosa]|uniref:Erythrocyte binding protein n=1 Tax=Reticulomyxa filosa TaxID=46433 RepID=X6NSG8_RETFI|nr:erythrocyte binding protein [Reticulomyxa filosa]|eukprot:ETO29240.1 erythrocyte binding protein [Reticulomyxa filosa]